MRELDRALADALARRDLSESQMGAVLDEVVRGEAEPIRLGALFVALRMKGEARSELVGAARFLLRHAVPIDVGLRPVTDMVGTGGDGGASFNVSTAASLVAAGAGVTMAKHGNRAVSGKSGAADVLAASGFNLDCPPEAMERAIAEIGFGFLFAPRLHPAFAKVGPVRKALGVRTLFNLLGPLVNPTRPAATVIGVYDAALTELLAGALHDLGVKRALIVQGHDGLDELTVTAPSRVTALDPEGGLHTRELFPEILFGQRFPAADIRGGTPEENAALMRAIFEGRKRDGARAIVVLNAAAAIFVSGLAPSIEEALPMAERAIDSGAALAKLTALVEASHVA